VDYGLPVPPIPGDTLRDNGKAWGITDLSHVTNVSQIVLKPAYFGLMGHKGKLRKETFFTGEKGDFKSGSATGIRTRV
jgi:hypothetical protein